MKRIAEKHLILHSAKALNKEYHAVIRKRRGKGRRRGGEKGKGKGKRKGKG